MSPSQRDWLGQRGNQTWAGGVDGGQQWPPPPCPPWRKAALTCEPYSRRHGLYLCSLIFTSVKGQQDMKKAWGQGGGKPEIFTWNFLYTYPPIWHISNNRLACVWKSKCFKVLSTQPSAESKSLRSAPQSCPLPHLPVVTQSQEVCD